MAKNDRWQESIDSINRSLKLVDEVNRSKILIGAAANERHIDRFVGPIFFRFFAPYYAGYCTLVLYFHSLVARENTVAHSCNIQPYCLLTHQMIYMYIAGHKKCQLYIPSLFECNGRSNLAEEIQFLLFLLIQLFGRSQH